MGIQAAKLLTVTLACACGLLLLLALLLQVGLGRGYHWLSADDDAVTGPGAANINRVPFKLPPETSFAQTDARPLFNEDRKPTPDTPTEVVPPPAPAVPLNVSLTGVILTPQLHLAMIHDNAKNDSVAVKEGMPLPGDLGGWTLTRVKERSAIFKEASGDEVEVELSTAVASPKPGTQARAGAPATASTMPQAPGSRPTPAMAKPPDGNQAEQLQRRIEERRKQMRDEAERLKQQQNPEHH
jgi:general secretion pathway protein N